MKNIYTNKFLISIIILLIICFAFCNKSYAISNMTKDADNFLNVGDSIRKSISEKSLKETSDFIYKAFFAVAIVLALIVGVVIGVKYIYESAEGQAKLKEAFIPYIVGCLIVFSSFGIWKMVVDFGNEKGLLEGDVEEELGPSGAGEMVEMTE